LTVAIMKNRFLGFLKQGLTPEKLALCVSLGAVIGIFPALGWTTLLCFGVAWALKLNQPAMQSVNYLVYPLQLALLIPFFRLGESLFGVPHLPITLDGARGLFHSGGLQAIRTLWDTTRRAALVWLALAPSMTWILYHLLLPVFRRLVPRPPGES